MDDAEAYGTFNMGIGYVFFVAPQDAERAQRVTDELGRPLLRLGHVASGTKQVSIQPLKLSFEGESLQIR
jgi:phosphoribosylformylglycinamidine cyclo-ligase